jgi:hypothetical protein
MGATEDTSARRVFVGQKPKGIAGWGTLKFYALGRACRSFPMIKNGLPEPKSR